MMKFCGARRHGSRVTSQRMQQQQHTSEQQQHTSEQQQHTSEQQLTIMQSSPGDVHRMRVYDSSINRLETS